MGRKIPTSILVTLVLAAFAAGSPCRAADSETCLGCHGDAATVGKDLVVDPLRFDHTAPLAD